MEEIEFNRWPKIKRFLNTEMIITEKLDGTNAQIVFKDGIMKVGSRNRWITPENDNFGFAAWVHEHAQELFDLLGEGRHYGEWVGKGIQRGYGMEDRKFFLFNTTRYVDLTQNNLVVTVPELYSGPISIVRIWEALVDLEEHGSNINNFHTPEGVIVQIGAERYKTYMEDLRLFPLLSLP